MGVGEEEGGVVGDGGAFCPSYGTQTLSVYLSLGDTEKSKLYFHVLPFSNRKKKPLIHRTLHPRQTRIPKQPLSFNKHIGSGVNYH